MTVTDLIDRYLAHAASVGLFCTEALAERQRTLGLFRAQHGDLAVEDCRAFHLSDWIEAHPGWHSSSTRKAKANQINALFNWAVNQGRIGLNPFRSVRYAEADPRPPMPDAVLADLLLRANKRFERACLFLRYTGCRLSDLFRMTWADVDLERGCVCLAQHKSRKRTGKPKIFALVAKAVELLAEVRKESGKSEGPVFLNTCGRPWTRRTLGQQLRRLKRAAGSNAVPTLHGIRHFWGSEAVRNGAPIKLVSLQLGHSTVAVTERYYLHLDNDVDAMRAAAEFAVRAK